MKQPNTNTSYNLEDVGGGDVILIGMYTFYLDSVCLLGSSILLYCYSRESVDSRYNVIGIQYLLIYMCV